MNRSRRKAESAFIAIFIGAVFLMFALSSMLGCGFPAALHKAHESIKAMSGVIEPSLASECMRRARRCKAMGIREPDFCEELITCRMWKKRYAMGVQQVHRGLSHCQGVYDDLKRAGVIR